MKKKITLLLFALLLPSVLNAQARSHGYVTVGGGATLRFDGFKYLPASTTNNIRVEERSPSRYWGIRGGVALSF